MRPRLSRWVVGLPIFALLVSVDVLHLVAEGRGYGVLAFVGVAAAAVTFRRPMVASGVVIATSLFLQLAHVGTAVADPIDLAQIGLERVLDGQSPYGVWLVNETGGLNPLAYGPLSMVTSIADRAGELVAATALLGVLAWQRAWITLCILAAAPMTVQSAVGGIEYLPTLLLALGFLALPTRPRTGMILLALAAAVKPHVAAWFLPTIGFAGWSAGLWVVGASAVLWSPLLVFGVGNYLHSLRLVYEADMPAEWGTLGVNVPIVRVLSVPVMALGLLVRRWDHALLVGTVAYVMVMFFGKWAHPFYLVPVIVAIGLALEARRLQLSDETPRGLGVVTDRAGPGDVQRSA